MTRHLRQSVFFLLALLAASGVVCACDVPVFRYALEKWEPSPYEVLVFHDGPMPAAERALLGQLESSGAKAKGDANLRVVAVDLEGTVPQGIRAIWDAEKEKTTPRMVLLYPLGQVPRRHVWSAEFTEDNVAALCTSPAREEIARRLIDGQTAVWVMIDSGDKNADDAAEAMLRKELAAMPGQLDLPPELAEEMPHLASHLRIEFSVMRISRTDPRERALTAMLLGSDGDAPGSLNDQAVVCPVYGRLRTLFKMVGPGIIPGNVLMGCGFLVGRCSCEEKDENMGIDLLMDFPWQNSLSVSLVDMLELPTPIGEGDTPPADDEALPAAVDEDSGSTLGRNVAIAVGLIILAAVALVIRENRKPKP